MANRVCYVYNAQVDGELVINKDEIELVVGFSIAILQIDSFSKTAARLEKQGILSPTGKAKWNREAISKLLSNEKYTSSLFLDELNSMPAHLQPKRQTLSFRMDKLGIENYKTKE